MKSEAIEKSTAAMKDEAIEEAKATTGASSARSVIIPVERVERNGAADRPSSWEILARIARTGMYLDLF